MTDYIQFIPALIFVIAGMIVLFKLALNAYFMAKERFVDRMLEKGRRNFDGER